MGADVCFGSEGELRDVLAHLVARPDTRLPHGVLHVRYSGQQVDCRDGFHGASRPIPVASWCGVLKTFNVDANR